ncbi:MAG: methyltransferase domain-containing protein [Candidatus Latescibacteria bacterium]|nr:methyltransferase domain-containing protein [Candidatus Latescibacterota bacterium]
MSKTVEPSGEYLLGTQDNELARLERQHQTWRSNTQALWQRAAFGPGQFLLDLACGSSSCTFDLARLVGAQGRVLAVDAAAKAIQLLAHEARRQGLDHLQTRTASIEVPLAERAVFDGAFARWILCFLPHPERLLATAHAALRPGGRLALMDYFNYRALALVPTEPLFATVFNAVYDSFHASGGNLDVGNRLPTLLAANGFVVESVEPVFRSAHPDSPIWAWVGDFIASYLPGLVEKGFLSANQFDAFQVLWAKATASKTALFCAPPVLTVTARKA